MSITLPEPSAQEQRSSEQLSAHIRAQIKANGPMSFARFMEMALYEPTLGYYRAGWQTFGRGGDFITAPELSPLFSQCVAVQCEQVCQLYDNACIIELGAGSGAMAVEILRFLEQRQTLPERYYILELSAQLQQRQRESIQQALPHLLERVEWLTSVPVDLCDGVVIANEVLDAMPVHQFQINQHGIQERCVTLDENEQFIFTLTPPTSVDLSKQVQALEIVHGDHYESEINLWLTPWLATIASGLRRGCFLLIDYGFPQHEYYLPQRHMGTLMCHYRHRAHPDPLIFPGIQDITSHVDFTAVAVAADQAGLDVLGFTNQAAFLMNCGLLDLINTDEQDECTSFSQNQAIKQLTLPHEMGELFKVMALGKGELPDLMGFDTMNQLERL